MDIFNRPPSIAEDTLQYAIYPSVNSSDKVSATSLAACIKSYAETLLPDFIWHRDAFEVKVTCNPDRAGSWILEGRMRVGDSVDDEWCTVWLLKEISSKWDVVISVYDSDGEFLLIEAAEALPSWVTPSNSENRIWIHNSRLHLIPLIHVSLSSRERRRRKLPGLPESDDEDAGEGDSYIAAEDAVPLVRDPSVETFAPLAVERLAWQRIAESFCSYPGAAKSHVHTTKAFIPEDIAKTLVVNPSLVQKAVEAFYTRDAIQLRSAHRMSRFPPSTAVLTAVKMTRTAYAQLMGQKFFPPKIFGSWKEREGTKEWRRRDVGMKIAVGFEMLYQESKGRQGSQNLSEDGIRSTAAARKDALQRDPEYQKYIQNLTNAGYFKGELQGSQLWGSLEHQAAATFVEVRRSNDASRQSFASQVTSALSRIKTLPDQSSATEDSDDWLNVDAEDFDRMLEATLGNADRGAAKDPNAMDVDNTNGVLSTEDQLASEQAKRLKDLATKVENFVEGEGDMEGVRFEDEELSEEPFSNDESDTDSDSDSESKKKRRLEQRQEDMNKLVPGLEPSEYGKMPASYHSNSQRVAAAAVETDAEEGNTERSAPKSETKAEEKPKAKPIRPPIIPRDKYDGVDSDDETDEETVGDDESEEDRPQVVGEIEIDMDEEEEEFLEFSRQALGIGDEQWASIVKDRKG
ncbi:hypothetical protein NLJ89_g2881 [Agrocybe chaxingu]|uniref:SGT1-domain-containing protein n=1 Tax=Agrocybe chaxingu TaxID=84603 RepID=A0A9W8MXS4_9AGAR|nr:hypothetical protein NLJ89_g2881 [Agrocybe chaxingu]